MNIWGIHNDTLTSELVDEGFVSLGWDEVGDLRDVPNGREGLKQLLAGFYPRCEVAVDRESGGSALPIQGRNATWRRDHRTIPA